MHKHQNTCQLACRLAMLLMGGCSAVAHAADFAWPQGQQAAVSLAYDDALASHLDVVIPQLNKLGFKASFYLTLSSATLVNRLDEWRQVAADGHELGNHSINHACRASLPGRQWVPPQHNLDTWTAQRMATEVLQANTRLHAIDGQLQRTFTPPCSDRLAGGQDYVTEVSPHFIAIRVAGTPITGMDSLDVKQVPAWSPQNPSLQSLIDYVEQAAANGTMANITFHGVGADYLQVDKDVHQAFLNYLAEHQDRFWVADFRRISLYIRDSQ
ncbi:polysaccharide deacetylase family protein [Bowmanella denitrificans]|uniref:polysaccharide deacetylase family protein n=1 Tax=Bowmanella denitrificans TaxID=366582 RepID=UPI000C9D1765|nr:polysaccharide deacetylase family protein [Bowmanella denitrificans]